MTLKLDQYLANIVKKECKISHFTTTVFGGKKDDLKGEIAGMIKKKFGDSFLEDADYLLFFKGGDIQKDDAASTLFGAVNRALGKKANDLSRADFKIISHDVTSYEPTEDGTDEEPAKEVTADEIDFIFVKVTLN